MKTFKIAKKKINIYIKNTWKNTNEITIIKKDEKIKNNEKNWKKE